MNTKDLMDKAVASAKLTRDEITYLLGNQSGYTEILQASDNTRKINLGDEVHLRGLIECSNICKNDCLYCGIRRSNHKIERYRLLENEIIELARKACSYGFKTIVIQSGEDPYYTMDRMVHIIREIKKLDVAVTLSMGEKKFEEYLAYRNAGADRYLLRIESTDKELYERLDPGMNWHNRYRCLLDIKKIGFELGSGIMVGLPGQSLQSIAEDLLFLQNLPVDMAGIGPFIPHPQTPLSDAKGGSFELAMVTMAIMRLLLPDINIPATTAMETLREQGRILALTAGANVIMPNVTEGRARRLYELYPGKICTTDTPIKCRSCIEMKILSINRILGSGYGGHRRKTI
jgi:biotin synthase